VVAPDPRVPNRVSAANLVITAGILHGYLDCPLADRLGNFQPDRWGAVSKQFEQNLARGGSHCPHFIDCLAKLVTGQLPDRLGPLIALFPVRYRVDTDVEYLSKFGVSEILGVLERGGIADTLPYAGCEACLSTCASAIAKYTNPAAIPVTMPTGQGTRPTP
jgi:hypothetical protein